MSVGGPPELQPLVPCPDDVRVFGHERRAGVAEVGPTGRLRLDSIARWVQDVAWADVEDAGLRELTIWLVRRTRIRVRRFPRLDERYALSTYVTGVGRMWAERRTDIVLVDGGTGGKRDGGVGGGADVKSDVAPAIEVATIWVHIDPERLLPSPVHQVEIDMWTGPSTRPVKARLGHPMPPASGGGGAASGGGGSASEGTWTFRASELDIAGHVNNAAYFTPLDDELLLGPASSSEVETVDVEVEYRTPAQAGRARLVSDGSMRWLVGEGDAGEVHASAVLADWPG